MAMTTLCSSLSTTAMRDQVNPTSASSSTHSAAGPRPMDSPAVTANTTSGITRTTRSRSIPERLHNARRTTPVNASDHSPILGSAGAHGQGLERRSSRRVGPGSGRARPGPVGGRSPTGPAAAPDDSCTSTPSAAAPTTPRRRNRRTPRERRWDGGIGYQLCRAPHQPSHRRLDARRAELGRRPHLGRRWQVVQVDRVMK